MSHASHENINIIDAGDHQYPPHSTPTLAPQEISNFVDGSGPIFSMYMEMATEEDKKLVENWKADADGILIFTGLFSAAVASLISVSIQDIRPNPQDTSNFYLANIFQTISDPNPPNNSSPLPASPPPFSPPNYAVWVNGLWLLSLVISVSCALLATLLQQWARRYLKITQPRYSPHKRARIRAFFAEGVDKFLLPWAVEALPTLLHVSLFLFFSGLVVFLCNVNLTIFKLVLSWVGVCAALYGCITLMPIFHHDSPYYTPLSLLTWHIVTGVSCAIFWVMLIPTFHYFSEVFARFWDLKNRYRKLLSHGRLKTAEETALNSPSEIATRAFMWTLDSLDEDHELERFFSGLPGFRNSKVVDDPFPSLTLHQKQRVSTALIELLDLTFSPNLLPEHIKNRRAIICAKAIDLTEIHCAYWHIVDRILSEDQYRGSQSAELGRIMKRWGDSGNEGAMLVVQAINTGIVARAQERDDSWFILASNELGVPESTIRDYALQGGSLSLAVLIHIIRHHFDHIQKWLLPGSTLSKILKATSRFDVQHTLPDLQHEFCAFWNQIVLRARNNDSGHITWNILRCIRHVYIALHQDTNSAPTRFTSSTNDQARILGFPSVYPLCIVPGHHPGSPHIHELEAIASASVSRGVPSSFPSFVENIPSSPVETVYQITIESPRVSVTLPDSLTPRATQDGVDPTAPFSTLELSASSRPSTPTSPPSAVTVLHTQAAHHYSPSDVPDIPSLPPTAVLDHMFHTSPSLSPDPPVTGSVHAASSLGSNLSILVPAGPGPEPSPPRLASALDPGTAVEGEGSTHVGSRKDKNALDPSVIHENVMASPDLSPQSPSPPTVAGVAIVGPSRSSHVLDVEHTGDHPPLTHPLHGQYDVV